MIDVMHTISGRGDQAYRTRTVNDQVYHGTPPTPPPTNFQGSISPHRCGKKYHTTYFWNPLDQIFTMLPLLQVIFSFENWFSGGVVISCTASSTVHPRAESRQPKPPRLVRCAGVSKREQKGKFTTRQANLPARDTPFLLKNHIRTVYNCCCITKFVSNQPSVNKRKTTG